MEGMILLINHVSIRREGGLLGGYPTVQTTDLTGPLSIYKLVPKVDTSRAAHDHPLAAFLGDPTGSVDDGEDAWEKWDGLLNTLLQKSPEELEKLVVVGQ
jgi:hypothetical protein